MERTKAKRWSLLLAGLVAVVMLVPAAQADDYGRRGIVVQPTPDHDFRVWIWPDRGEGGEYLPGDNIRINVEVTRSCFLILYNIDTRGNLRILYPYDPWDDNYVAAGEVISFPRPWDMYEWTVDGPSGIEYVQAIASEFPIRPPDWPIYMRSVNHGGAVCLDPELRDFRAGRNRLDYIRTVNRKITGRYWDWCATDLASFYVQPRYHRPTWHDPWPDVFYGEIYIGWPIGGRIYIDDVYVGIAPLWIPRRYGHGQHVVVCRDGGRVVRKQTVHYYPKRRYKYTHVPVQRDVVIERGNVKPGRRGGVEHFKVEVDRDRHRRDDHRLPAANKRGRGDVHVERRTTVTHERTRTVDRDRGQSRVTVDRSRTRSVDIDRSVSKRATNSTRSMESGRTARQSAHSKVTNRPRMETRNDRQSAQVSRSAGKSQQSISNAKRNSSVSAKIKSRDRTIERKATVERSKSRTVTKSRARETSGKRRK